MKQIDDSSVLITGGSGYIGQALSHKLSQNQHTVVSMYRHRIPDSDRSVFPVCCDMSSVELLAAPLRGVKSVFHLAWDLEVEDSNSHQLNDSLDSGTTRNLKNLRNLIEACLQASVERLVFLSPLGANKYGKNFYLREKYKAEHMLINSGLAGVDIIRTGLVFGGAKNNDKFLNTVRRLMRLPFFYPVPKTDRYLSLVNLDQVTDLLTQILKESAFGGVRMTELKSLKPQTVQEVFQLISKSCRPGRRIGVGAGLGNYLTPWMLDSGKSRRDSQLLHHFLEVGGEGRGDIEMNDPFSHYRNENVESFESYLKEAI